MNLMILKKIILLLPILCAMLPCSGAVPLTLEQCVDSALARNPAVGAAALEVERARLMRATAFDPPMTEVTLKQETTGGGGPENGVYFGQQFDFPTLYVARHRSLSAQTDLAGSRFDLLVRDVRREVASAYCSLLYSGELLRLYTEEAGLYDEFCRVAEVRLGEGEAGALELMNARRVREKNAMESREEEQNYRRLQLELQRLIGSRELPVPSENLAAFRSMTPSRDALPAPGEEWPEIRVAAAEIAVADREYAVARQELLPGIKLGATVQALIKSFNPYHVERLPFEKGNFMGFEVGVTVPLFFGAQRARLKAADVERRIAMLNMETALSRVESRQAELGARLASLAGRLDYYEKTALPQAAEIRRIALVSYELGDIDYIEYIANMETVYTVSREYAALLLDYRLAEVELGGTWKN